MGRRDVALWILAIVLAIAAGLLAVRVAVFPTAGVLAEAQEGEPAAGVEINDMVLTGRPGELTWLESGRNAEITAATDDGLKVYNVREFQGEYSVSELEREGGETATGTPRR